MEPIISVARYIKRLAKDGLLDRKAAAAVLRYDGAPRILDPEDQFGIDCLAYAHQAYLDNPVLARHIAPPMLRLDLAAFAPGYAGIEEYAHAVAKQANFKALRRHADFPRDSCGAVPTAEAYVLYLILRDATDIRYEAATRNQALCETKHRYLREPGATPVSFRWDYQEDLAIMGLVPLTEEVTDDALHEAVKAYAGKFAARAASDGRGAEE